MPASDVPLSVRTLPHRPFTTVFYSFRGGVGRTTLATSVAIQMQTTTALLDMDLECPGVDQFRCTVPPANQKGLVEYIGDCERSKGQPPLRDYVYKGFNGDQFEHGRVLRAGRIDDAYLRDLWLLDWKRFYREEGGALVLENLRAGLKKEFAREFLIIDSRTGLAETASVALQHLADAVVFVFYPTKGHEQGLKLAANILREREQKEGRLIPRLYVAPRAPRKSDTAVSDAAVEFSEKLVERCEGQGVVDWSTSLREADWVANDKCALLLVPQRVVDKPTDGESFLAWDDQFPTNLGHSMTELAIGRIAEWIGNMAQEIHPTKPERTYALAPDGPAISL